MLAQSRDVEHTREHTNDEVATTFDVGHMTNVTSIISDEDEPGPSTAKDSDTDVQSTSSSFSLQESQPLISESFAAIRSYSGKHNVLF